MQHRGVTEPHPVVSAAVACVVGLIAFLIPWSCAGGQLTPLMQCRLAALEVLPEDPAMATVYDAVDVVERMLACKREHAVADAGP